MTTGPGQRAAPGDAPEQGAGPAERAELAVVALAVAQGALLAAWLGLFPAAVLRAGGFPPAPAFFVRWAGLLHLVLAAGYVLEWARFRRVTLLVLAKTATALFLAGTWIAGGLPTLLVVAIGVEGALAAGGALLHGPAERSRRARARLRLVTPGRAAVRPASRR